MITRVGDNVQTNFNTVVGLLLKELRDKNGITLKHASMSTNHSISWLSDLEKGRTRIFYDDLKISWRCIMKILTTPIIM